MYNYIISAIIALALSVGGWFGMQQFTKEPTPPQTLGLSTLLPVQGGTGLKSATAGDVGKILSVSDDDPFTFVLAADQTGAGGGTYPFTPSVSWGAEAQSTSSIMAFPQALISSSTIGQLTAGYLTATTTTATSTFAGGITAGGVAISNLTAGRVPYVGTGGFLTDISTMTFNGTALSVFNIAGHYYNYATDLDIRDSSAGGNITLFTTYVSGQQNERLRITSAGNIGIGTTSPWALLSLTGTTTNTNLGSVPYFVVATTTGTATTTAFIIDSNGKVGIGTTTPAAVLGVAGNLMVSDHLDVTGTATSTFAGGISTQRLTTTASSTITGLVITGGGAQLQTLKSCSGGVITDASGSVICNTTAFASSGTTITVAGTTNQITSSAGAQDLSTNRTWTLSLPNAVTFPGSFTTTYGTSTLFASASSTIGRVTVGALVATSTVTVPAGSIAVAGLAASTISGVALGGTLNALTNDTTLVGSSYTGAAAVSDWGIDLTNANSWTGAQTFRNATSTTMLGANLLYVASSTIGKAVVGSLTATSSLSAPFWVSFSYASSSWTGTTTLMLGPAGAAETWSTIYCETNAGTANVRVYDGTNSMNYLNASTTIGTFTLSTNNTFTAAESRRVDIGTPATSPARIGCTVKITR